ncbi:MAG: chromosomal replication initiator DnaA [Pseudomonadota bacterium]
MTEQLVFDLPADTAFGRDDFFVSDANARAVAQLEDWQNWPLGKLLLTGPKGSGKSHLAQIWAEAAGAGRIRAADLSADDVARLAETGAAVEDVPDAPAAAQEALFHLHNLCAANSRPLLLTGRGEAPRWSLGLADLNSRIAAALAVGVGAPDDHLLHALFIKLFNDRQLRVSPRVLRQLLLRSERSFAFVVDLVDILDKQALARGSSVTHALVSDVLAQMEGNS